MIRVALGFITNQEGQYLVAKRNANKQFGGLWEFPGGKIERDETPQQAIVREIFEEFRLSIEPIILHKSYQWGDTDPIEFYPVACRFSRPNQKMVPTEHQDFAFKNVEEIGALELAPPDYQALSLLRA